MGILDGNPKNEPLHYGEIYDIWQFSMKAKGCMSVYQAYGYHAGDEDLKKLLHDLIDQAALEAKECDAILTHNGMVPPPALPDRPKTKLEDIPAGVRFSDQEIAAMLTVDSTAGLVVCSQVLGKAIREDICVLFGKYHATKSALGLRILRMNKEKGWLVPPPLQVKRPDLVEV